MKKIINWSRTKSCYADVFHPKEYFEISNIIKSNNSNQKISFRASGGSYGDSTLNDGGKIIYLNNFNRILSLDEEKQSVVVQSGVKIQDLLNHIMPKGFYIHSVPGFNEATIGGCINSNVHGKDAHLKGVFGNNVLSLKVMNSEGQISTLKKGSEEFLSTIGFYGLTYVILEAELKISKIKSTLLDVKTVKFSTYEGLIKLFEKNESTNHDMMGAWINHFDYLGSGIFKAARWSHNSSSFKKINLINNFLKKIIILFIYPFINFFIVNRFIIKRLNSILFNFTQESQKITHYKNFYFPQQTYLPDESKLYSKGKVNIQILIPKNNALEILHTISKLCKTYKMESWWLGIKKHKHDAYILSYALDGYDITLQWSKKYTEQKKFDIFYKELIELVLKNKCLIYLTQDILLNKKVFEKIYKDHKKFKEIKIKFDKNKLFNNCLYQRLFD